MLHRVRHRLEQIQPLNLMPRRRRPQLKAALIRKLSLARAQLRPRIRPRRQQHPRPLLRTRSHIPILLPMQVKLLDLQAQYLPLRHEIRHAIDEVCDSQTLILGPAVEQFERTLASYCNTKHAIGVSSGTDALLCTLMAIGIKAGDEVICPTFTFFATAGSIARLGAVPVFVDIDPATYNLSPESVVKKLTAKTKA